MCQRYLHILTAMTNLTPAVESWIRDIFSYQEVDLVIATWWHWMSSKALAHLSTFTPKLCRNSHELANYHLRLSNSLFHHDNDAQARQFVISLILISSKQMKHAPRTSTSSFRSRSSYSPTNVQAPHLTHSSAFCHFPWLWRQTTRRTDRMMMQRKHDDVLCVTFSSFSESWRTLKRAHGGADIVLSCLGCQIRSTRMCKDEMFACFMLGDACACAGVRGVLCTVSGFW